MSALPDNQVFYIDSAGHLPECEYLQGYLELDDALIINNAGLTKYRQQGGQVPWAQPLDGAFIGLFEGSDGYFLTTDISGQELIYSYVSGDKWAFSNSLYYLRQAVTTQGWPLTPHHHAIQLLGTRGWNAQPYTHQSVFEEVRLLATTQYVLIPRAASPNESEVMPVIHDHTWAKILKPQQPAELKVLIADALTSSFRTMQAFARIGHEFDVICQVSGGYDSRTSLALLSHCRENTSQLHAQSNKSSPQELAVAKQVTTKTPFKLNDFKARKRDISSEHAYQIWKLSSLGNYVPIYTASYSSPSYAIQIKGDLSISNGTMYGRHSRSMRNRARSAVDDKSLKRFITNELDNFRDSILAQGFTERSIVMLLYAEFRSRFHCGRRWVRALSPYGMVYSPLTNSKLMRAAWFAGEQGLSLKQFKMQLLLAADDTIAVLPYSDKDKDFTEAELEQRLFDSSLVFTEKAREVFIDKEDYTRAYAPSVDTKSSRADFVHLLRADFERYRDQLKKAGYVSDDTIERAENELTKEGLSLAHNYRHVSLCVNMGFAYFG